MSTTLIVEATLPDGRQVRVSIYSDGVNAIENGQRDVNLYLDGHVVPNATLSIEDDDE